MKLYIACGIAVALLLFIVILCNWKPKPKKKHGPYYKTDFLLTKNENLFFQVLLDAAPRYYICPKVRLGDIVHVPGMRDQNWFRIYAKVSQKHIDFVLCDRATMAIVACIELDDKSHSGADAKKRDAEKNYACESAEIKLLRYTSQKEYSVKEIRAFFKENHLRYR